jgi:hypothetical protein
MITHDPLYLIGPDFLLGLPLFPPGDPEDFLIDVAHDLAPAAEQKNAMLLMTPSPTEWVELAVRAGRVLDADELVDAKRLLRLSDMDPLTLRGATLAQQCRQWCLQMLPYGTDIVIDQNGAVLLRTAEITWHTLRNRF